MKKSQIYITLIVLLLLSAVYLWSLPFQKNRLPYGEVDAVSHFIIGDYTAQTDKPITTLPYFLDLRYGEDNTFRPHTLWYPPPYHVNFAVAQILGGERVLPIFLLNVIESLLFVIGVYFLIRELFGFWPAFLSSFLLIFSTRDYMVYLWGQWPERMGLAYLPVILYCFYKHAEDKKNIYLYIAAILLSINLFIHPVTFFHSSAAVVVFLIFLSIKQKKIPFNIKHMLFAIIIFLLISSIFYQQTASVIFRFNKPPVDKPAEVGDFSRLFHWFKTPAVNPGVPEDYFSYPKMNGGYWTLPLLFLGVIFLILKRDKKSILLLSWLVSLYLILHMDILGLHPYSHRSLSATAHIFYPIAVLGLFFILTFFKQSTFKNYLKYSLIFLFILTTLLFNARPAYSELKNAYSGIGRISQAQYDASEFIKDELPNNSKINQVGAITQAKSRWMWMLSYSAISYTGSIERPDYFIFDYSDAYLLNNVDMISQIKNVELQLANNTIIYDKGNIKVYKIG